MSVIVVWLRGWLSNDEFGLHISTWFVVFMSSVVNWTALVGFFKSHSMEKEGVMNYLVLLFIQLMLLPLFCLLELASVIVAVMRLVT